ncbi:MAG: hypothetical protein IPL61_21450 [Myxococcales bacterium]|nr:hypothetical protein [Myxococcales bacterium]
MTTPVRPALAPSDRCNLVAGAVATGAPLTDAERAHLDGCADCAALVALPRALARTARAADPGPGFSARMTAGAHRRIVVRRRRRITTVAVAAAAAVLLMFVSVQQVRHAPRDQALRPALATHVPSEQPARARELLELARFDRAMAPAAPWQDIEAPLRSHRALLDQHRLRTGGSR